MKRALEPHSYYAFCGKGQTTSHSVFVYCKKKKTNKKITSDALNRLSRLLFVFVSCCLVSRRRAVHVWDVQMSDRVRQIVSVCTFLLTNSLWIPLVIVNNIAYQNDRVGLLTQTGQRKKNLSRHWYGILMFGQKTF